MVPFVGYVLQLPKDGQKQTWLEQDALPPLPHVSAQILLSGMMLASALLNARVLLRGENSRI